MFDTTLVQIADRDGIAVIAMDEIGDFPIEAGCRKRHDVSNLAQGVQAT